MPDGERAQGRRARPVRAAGERIEGPGPTRRGTWYPALAATDLKGVHFHDLRHAGNHLLAEAGANLRELMERMGHSSSGRRIYLHSTPDRQRALADAIGARARQDLTRTSRGTSVAREGQAHASSDDPPKERGPPELQKCGRPEQCFVS
jgi:hypothetical protein